jgi:hypothetical protein
LVLLVAGVLATQVQSSAAERPGTTVDTGGVHHRVQRAAEVTGADPSPLRVAPGEAVIPPPPPPVVVPAPPPPAAPAPYYQRIGDEGLARISYPWRRLGYQLSFAPGRAGLLGGTSCAGHDIIIYVRPSQTVGEVAFVTAFEIAHAVDCTYLTPSSRMQWGQVRGFRGYSSWFPSCTCSEDNFGSGDYAEVFASWQVGLQLGWRSNRAGPPDPAQIQRLMPDLTVGS